MHFRQSRTFFAWFAALALFALSACEGVSPTPLLPSQTPQPPTQTPLPMAITINGGGITAAEFEEELARFQAAQTSLGYSVSLDEATRQVLDDLTNLVLLEQGAQEAGFIVDDAMLSARIDGLAAQIGGMQALADWEEQHGYTDASLRQSLRRQMAAAWMRDQIIASVPSTAEQVHVQQILLYNLDKAQAVLEQLNSGADFASLATEIDPVTRGELGWFPRGYLPDIQVEEAAFTLQPGQYSTIVETRAGFSILLVLERETGHILSPDASLALQALALENWLKDKRMQSNIQLAP